MHEAIGSRRRREHRGAARPRAARRVHRSSRHARVVESSDRRADLARERRAHRAVGPLSSTVRRARESRGRRRSRRRRARTRDCPAAGRSGDARSVQGRSGLLGRMAMPCTASSPWAATSIGARSSMPTLDPPDTMTTSASACSPARIASASSRTSPGKSTMAPSRSASAASIGPFASVMWKPCGGEPDGSSSLPVMTSRTRGRRTTRRVAEADRAHHAEILRTQDPSRLEHRGAGDDVLAATADVLARRDRGYRCDSLRGRDRIESLAASTSFGELGREHGVTASGHRRARHDAHRFAARDRSSEGRSGQRVADDGQRNPVVGVAPSVRLGDDGVAVHRRAVESGNVDGR